MRVGIGVDAHRLVPGRPLVLGGVSIPSDAGLEGHSDADVLAHAIADALLGAAALGDLGVHFPGTDRWRDASSIEILTAVRMLLAEAGWRVGNVDASIVLERPRLAPYVEEMRANVSAALDVATTAVSVKATTSDGLGFAGRGEGASALAVVHLEPLG